MTPIDEQLCAAAGKMREYAIFALDADGVVTTWNAGAQRIKGYRSEEIIGRHFSVFYPPDKIASGHPDWELRQAEASGCYIDQGWRLRKDGSRFWAHVVITAQRSSTGQLTGFIKVTRDESEVHTRQERAGRRFHDLFALAPVGIALFDESYRLLDANGALCDLLGYRLTDMVGKSGDELLHTSESSVQPRQVPHDWLRGQRTMRRADGAAVICDVHGAVSTLDDGSRFWQVVFQDVTEQVHHTQHLHHQATHDGLTGLRNRQGIQELLASLRHSTDGLAVLFCDLDNFKRVNDSLDHEAGDELLRAVARRLVNELPPQCTPGRLYGDEYLIICSDVAACGGLDALAAHVSRLFRMVVPIRGRPVHMSASIGAARIEDPDTAAEDLVRFADAAMFDAKNRPGHTTLAGPALIRSVTGQVPLEEYLRGALDHDRLTLHYQPIIGSDGSVLMAEALLRAPHPDHGLLYPDTLLPVAGRGGLLEELDRWVLRTALREAATWDRPVPIAVNLSGLSPDQQHFTGAVSNAINTSGIDAHRVVLEMVETTFVDLPSYPLHTMEELQQYGIRFAMDDFGTGYSSLARLKDLPTQIIKLDQRFVCGLGHDPADAGVARAVVDLTHSMGRVCIAEGVETTTQLRHLRDLEVDGYQGWLFSRPLPAPELRELLTNPRDHPSLLVASRADSSAYPPPARSS